MGSSENHSDEDLLVLAPGETALAELPGGRTLLSALPPPPYENLLVVTVSLPKSVETAVRQGVATHRTSASSRSRRRR